MDWIANHWLALALIAAYLVVILRHAVEGQRATRGLAGYYVGGRSMGGVAIGLSFFATYASTNSFIGFSGQAYSFGAPWLLLTVAFIFFLIVAWVWVAPRLRVFTAALQSITVPDFFGFRYDSPAVRVLAAGIVIFAGLLYMAAVFKGVGGLVSAYLDIGYRLAIAAVLVIVVVYTAVGGFISVVKTDVVQGLIMIVAAVVLFVGVVRAAGGVGSISGLMEAPASAHLFTWDAAMPFPLLLGIIVAGSMKLIVEPRMLSRFYALRDPAAVRQGLVVSLMAMLVVFVLLTPIGLYARVIFPAGDLDPDLVVPVLIGRSEIFSPLASSFLLVAILGAAMSSLDSVLLVTATTCHRDLVGLVRPPRDEAGALRATRGLVAVFATLAAIIAFDPPGSIVALTAFSGSLYAACFFPALIFGLYWKRGNGPAALASMVVGLVTVLAWRHFTPLAGVHEVFPSLLFSMLTFVAVALARPTDPSPRVAALLDEAGRS